VLTAVLLVVGGMTLAENVDPSDNGSQYVWGGNVGWINFQPGQGPGVNVDDAKLTGYVWAENIGWINLSCENTGYCGTVDYGVTNDGEGNLAGYAWAPNIGWISFSCENTGTCEKVDYGVRIDPAGNVVGQAWSPNIGWINFDIEQNGLVVCKVNFVDLANFADQWLQSGQNVSADLTGNSEVDLLDYGRLGLHWHQFCPEGWTLK